MARVTYLDPAGTRHDLDVPAGRSVMEGAIRGGVPGIDADCGGACACATCHVYVAPDWLAATGVAGEAEESMLEFALEPRANSRLSCQIEVTPALDGLVVRVPPRQA